MEYERKKRTYKIIKEYGNYYLTESSFGDKECFSKYGYKPINGYIQKPDNNLKGGIPTPPNKVNRNFNLYRGRV